MNTQRVLVLGVAALAAGAAALLARSLLGGGTEKVKAALPPPRVAVAQILVATNYLQPGVALTPGAVHWQAWPKSVVDQSFILKTNGEDIGQIIQGTVVRAPMVAGEPVTTTKIVHSNSAGLMASMVQDGMRAVSIGISTETGAGGFILPNDHVDVIVTQQVSDAPKRYGSHTILTGVRVLAVDQTYREDKDQKVVIAKTATLELTPRQVEKVERGLASGTVSLALRALGDSGVSPEQPTQTANTNVHLPETTPNKPQPDKSVQQQQPDDGVTIINYGQTNSAGQGG